MSENKAPVTVPVKHLKAGSRFLHPVSSVPLRRVEPKNFNFTASPVNDKMVDLLRIAVFAVDDEGGLYAMHPDNQVAIPYNVPLVTEDSTDNYLVLVTVERQISDDLPILAENYLRGNIKADPEKDFEQAAMQQVALELQDAYNDGMTGFLQCHAVLRNKAFDTDAMGWEHGADDAAAGR